MTRRPKCYETYTHLEMHAMLANCCLSASYRAAYQAHAFIETQALFCPYYVPLTGVLGMDWGIVLNPASPRFGLLTFEHDDCCCPEPHGSGSQRGTDWIRR